MRSPRIPLGILPLAVGGFGIGLTEFAIVGLLPELSVDLQVDEAAAGWLVSGYALSVAGGGVALTALASRFDRKWALLALVGLFIIGNAMSALAPDYGLMLAGRIVAALCHGAFFGIGAVLAADIAGEARRGAAISIMFGGLTLANVLGVPLGALVGQAFGWRATFWLIVCVGVASIVAIAAWVPRHPPEPSQGIGRQFAALARPQVLSSLLLTVLGFGGMFGAFTYIAFTLTEVSGFDSSAIPALLLVFGASLVIGNYIGGRLADHALNRTLIIGLALLTLTLLGFAMTAANPIAAAIFLGLMGLFGFGLVPGLQSRVLTFAKDAPTLASGANIAAFNLGNGLGAWLGGITIAAGLGYTSTIVDAAIMTALALVVAVLATAAHLRQTRPKYPEPTAASQISSTRSASPPSSDF